MQHPQINLIIFKLEPTTPILLQHVATGWPAYCTQQCCSHLAGALEGLVLPATNRYSSLIQTSGRTLTVCLPDEMMHVAKLEKVQFVNSLTVQF